MMLAQKLYEGININGNHKGFDYLYENGLYENFSEAKEMAKSYITETFGKEYVTDVKKRKSKNKKSKMLMKDSTYGCAMSPRKV